PERDNSGEVRGQAGRRGDDAGRDPPGHGPGSPGRAAGGSARPPGGAERRPGGAHRGPAGPDRRAGAAGPGAGRRARRASRGAGRGPGAGRAPGWAGPPPGVGGPAHLAGPARPGLGAPAHLCFGFGLLRGVAMGRVVVLGGGMIGQCTAMMLADQGCDVTVLERDDAPVPSSPGEAWQAWDRPRVAEFRQPHFLHPAGARILDSWLAGVWESLARAQAARFSSLDIMPPFITDRGSQDGDERFVTRTGRRPVLEYAVASVAGQRLDIRRGTTVAGLLAGAPAAPSAPPVPGTPHVTGVRLADGTELPADLVVDAMGRRSAMPAWLSGIGAQPPEEEAEDSGFIYYTRFFRPAAGAGVPPYRAGLLTHFECFSLLTLPGDTDTWSVTVYLASGDQALKGLRHAGPWTALVEACPMHAHLLQGEPITDVLAMGGVVDRRRRFVVAGAPVVTGVVSVGDAWGCTNPSLGRGITMGLMHAAGTAEVIRDHLGDPLALAHAHDEMTQATVTPWYQNTTQLGRARRAQ